VTEKKYIHLERGYHPKLPAAAFGRENKYIPRGTGLDMINLFSRTQMFPTKTGHSESETDCALINKHST